MIENNKWTILERECTHNITKEKSGIEVEERKKANINFELLLQKFIEKH